MHCWCIPHCYHLLEDPFEEFDLFTLPFLGTCNKEIISNVDKTIQKIYATGTEA